MAPAAQSPSSVSLWSLANNFLDSCGKLQHSSICESCKIGELPRLPFPNSTSFTTAPFQIIHCDLWLSPVCSCSDFQYYLVVIDEFTHYSWVFPLRNKSSTAATLLNFFSYVHTQYYLSIKCVQCDNGGEFISYFLHNHFSRHGVVFRFSCPPTPLHKMAKLSVSCRQTMTFFAPYSSTRTCHSSIGSRPSIRQTISSIEHKGYLLLSFSVLNRRWVRALLQGDFKGAGLSPS